MEQTIRGTVKQALGRSTKALVALLVVTTVVFPVGEGILSSMLTDGGRVRATTLISLAVVALAHLALATVVVYMQASPPTSSFGMALDLEDRASELEKQLTRKESACRLALRAFETLSTESCNPRRSGGGTDPLEVGMNAIVQPLLDQLHAVVGVHGSTYSVEVYVQRLEREEPQRIYFYGALLDRERTEVIGRNLASDACRLRRPAMPYQQPVINERHRWHRESDAESEPYFKHYAVAPIFSACGAAPFPIGALVVTSMQDRPFAADGVELLGFIAAIVARYLWTSSVGGIPEPRVAGNATSGSSNR
jgi:hypothetical protein